MPEGPTTTIGLNAQVTGDAAARAAIGGIYQELRSGTITAEQANTALKNYSASIYAQRRAIMLVRTSLRNQMAVQLEAMRGMMSVASIGRSLLHIYNSMVLTQIRMQSSTRNLSEAREELRGVQARYLQVSQDLGRNSVYAQSLLEQERDLSKQVKDETIDLTSAQRDSKLMWAGISLELVGVIAKLIDVYMHYQNVQGIMGILGGGGGAAGALLGGAGGAALGGAGQTTLPGILGGGLGGAGGGGLGAAGGLMAAGGGAMGGIVGGIGLGLGVYAAMTPEERTQHARMSHMKQSAAATTIGARTEEQAFTIGTMNISQAVNVTTPQDYVKAAEAMKETIIKEIAGGRYR